MSLGRDDGRSGLRLQLRSRAGQQRPHRQAVHPVQPRGSNQRDAPWRIALPQGGVIVGEGSGWPVAAGSMPANLKIVRSRPAARAPWSRTTATTSARSLSEDRGDDRQRHRDAPSAAERRDDRRHPDRDSCTARPTTRRAQPEAAARQQVQRLAASAPARAPRSRLWLPLAGVILALRRRRPKVRSRSAEGAEER